MAGDLVDEAGNACACEVLNLVPVNLDLALDYATEGLEKLSAPVVGVLEADLSFERVHFRCYKVKSFLLLAKRPSFEIVIRYDLVRGVLLLLRQTTGNVVEVVVECAQLFRRDGQGGLVDGYADVMHKLAIELVEDQPSVDVWMGHGFKHHRKEHFDCPLVADAEVAHAQAVVDALVAVIDSADDAA